MLFRNIIVVVFAGIEGGGRRDRREGREREIREREGSTCQWGHTYFLMINRFHTYFLIIISLKCHVNAMQNKNQVNSVTLA